MPSNEKFKNLIINTLSELGPITVKKMMGDYLLYFESVLIGGIYDDRLLIKITKTNEDKNISKTLPYLGAKPMFIIENLDDKQKFFDIIYNTYNDLK